MSIARISRSVGAASLVVALTTGCAPGEPGTVATAAPPAPSAGPSQLAPTVAEVEVIATGLRAPWSATFLPGGDALITERDSGRVMRLDAGRQLTEVGVIDESDSRAEGGLMGIAASPDYGNDQTLFLYYTSKSDNRIARWKIGERPQPIVTDIPISGIHNGGRLAFGPDGFLYATTGDAGVRGRSQDLNSLGGKILRMTPDGKPAPGNPFDNLVWSYGHRNVQGIAWDSGDNLWATEFGQNTWDEINLIERGKNYGWPEVEGAAGDARFVDPVVAWPPTEASCSGAAVLGDVLATACLRGERLWMMQLDGKGALTGAPVAALTGDYGRLRDAVAAPDGSLWVLTSNHDGRGDPVADDDRILRVTLESVSAQGS